MLKDSNASTRGTAIYAFRDIISSTDSTYNKYLRTILIEVLTAMMRDANPDNRKTALNTFSAAARHKPELVLPSLSQLLPPVLDQTFEDPALTREVSMGPFKHKVDDGLEARKSAYETLYSLLELSTANLQPLIPAIYPRVVAGVAGDHNIRSLCNYIILKLAAVAPDETVLALDDMADKFTGVLSITLKETAVRTEIEKVDEAKRNAVRVAYQVQRQLAERGAKVGEAGMGVKWVLFLEECRREWGNVVKEVEREMRERVV